MVPSLAAVVVEVAAVVVQFMEVALVAVAVTLVAVVAVLGADGVALVMFLLAVLVLLFLKCQLPITQAHILVLT